MKYTLAKIIRIVIGLPLLLLGLTILLVLAASAVTGTDVEEPVGIFIFGVVLMVIGLSVLYSIVQINRFQKKTYQWYKETYPKFVKGNRVACHSCNNTRINIRNLMKRTYHREHVCTQCGTTLYYSPERHA